MIVAPFRPTTLAKNAQTLVSRVNSRTCDSFIGPRKALENPKYLTKTYFYQPFAAREHRQIGSWFCETESCEGNNLSGIGPHFPQDSRPLRFKKNEASKQNHRMEVSSNHDRNPGGRFCFKWAASLARRQDARNKTAC